MLKLICALTVIQLLLFSCATPPQLQMSESKLEYPYTKLKLLDLEQMFEIIQGKMKQYKKTNNEEFLLESIKICLSRPDGDGLVEKIIDNIRFSLDENDKWEKALEKVVQQSISELRLETTAGEDQLTYLILLENLVSELKPEFIRQYQSPKFETKLIQSIADARITVSKAATTESRLNLMTSQKSPSSMAQTLINEKNQKLNIK